ncbi:hypothetical protein BSKO_01894 [Bryopsis sp. KO-2023]|nr:hypothetical protein BSKO_01894 [Bryopsis sp. KO-2023]
MTEVLLNVYDVTSAESQTTTSTINVINNVTHALNLGGVFHGAVEVFGEEWSFGYCVRGTGVYACPPKQNPFYQHRETLLLGVTKKSRQEVNAIISRLKVEWPGGTYNLLNRNCCHFCEDICKYLGVGPVPGWLNRFAAGAEATINFADKVAVSWSNWSTQMQQTTQQSTSWLKNSLRNLTNGRNGAEDGVGENSSEVEPQPQSRFRTSGLRVQKPPPTN